MQENAKLKDSFPLQMWNGAFFISFVDLSVLKILASAKQSKKIKKLAVEFLFLLLIFSCLTFKRALSEVKKSIKQPKNTSFHACCGNETLCKQ